MTVRQRYVDVNVTTPPGTTVAARQTTDVTLGDVKLTRVDVRIPPGPSGLVGISVVFNGVSLVPWAPNPIYLIGDDEHFGVPVNTEVTAHLQIFTYNLDIYPHTVYFRFLVTPMSLLQATTLPLASSVVLG